jgi:hypothetical protein
MIYRADKVCGLGYRRHISSNMKPLSGDLNHSVAGLLGSDLTGKLHTSTLSSADVAKDITSIEPDRRDFRLTS